MLHEARKKSVEHRRWGLVAESVDLEQHRTTDPTGEGATAAILAILEGLQPPL